MDKNWIGKFGGRMESELHLHYIDFEVVLSEHIQSKIRKLSLSQIKPVYHQTYMSIMIYDCFRFDQVLFRLTSVIKQS